MEVFTQEAENKRMEQELIKTQILNLKMFETKREKVQASIEEDRHRLLKQLQTMKGLKSALETQLKN
jgi:D-Tyr-tRNAtyr deacylase